MKRRRVFATCLLLGWLACSSRASAQAAPNEVRSSQYYAVHSSIVVALLASGVTTHYLFRPSAGADFGWFPGDTSLRGRRSVAAAELSNTFIGLSVAEPVFTQLGRGADAHFANFGVVYGETVSANLLLNGLVKLAVRRPRPYTYGIAEADDRDAGDRNVSFYSGHSSTAFAAALAGSLLFAESAPDRVSKLAVWFSQLAFASAAANLRVRAGKHYYSDVVVGALIGTGMGALVPALHGGHYAPEPSEYLAAGGGLLLGVGISQFVPLIVEPPPKQSSVGWSLTPWACAQGSGLSVQGGF